MTHFSLKRTLLKQLNQVMRFNYKAADKQFIPLLRNSGNLDPTLLRIGKSSLFCHPNIPLKKTSRVNSVIYASAISLKLENDWRQPANQIAIYVEKVLKNDQTLTSVRMTSVSLLEIDLLWPEFTIQVQSDNLISFKLSNLGLWLWIQRLHLLDTLEHSAPKPWIATSSKLWPIQYAYGRCCALLRPTSLQSDSNTAISLTAPIQGWPLAVELLHTIINAIDTWEADTQKDEPLHQALLFKRLLAISQAFATYDGHYFLNQSPEYWTSWIGIVKATQITLKQLGRNTLGLPLSSHL